MQTDQIVAQLSLYPLDSEDMLKSIYRFLDIFKSHGLNVEIREMSSVIWGPESAFFEVLPKAYQEAGDEGKFVLIITLSNAAPHPLPGGGEKGKKGKVEMG